MAKKWFLAMKNSETKKLCEVDKKFLDNTKHTAPSAQLWELLVEKKIIIFGLGAPPCVCVCGRNFISALFQSVFCSFYEKKNKKFGDSPKIICYCKTMWHSTNSYFAIFPMSFFAFDDFRDYEYSTESTAHRHIAFVDFSLSQSMSDTDLNAI